jgi:hypothetical protein
MYKQQPGFHFQCVGSSVYGNDDGLIHVFFVNAVNKLPGSFHGFIDHPFDQDRHHGTLVFFTSTQV